MITKLSTLRKMWVPTGFVPYILKHFIVQQLGITKCMVLHSCLASAKETHLIIFCYTCMWALLEMSKKKWISWHCLIMPNVKLNILTLSHQKLSNKPRSFSDL